jgi:hypothetical protein
MLQCRSGEAWLGIALERVVNQCVNCGRETPNPKFCSRRCSAIANNQAKPKRQRKRYVCLVCGSEAGHRRNYCALHSTRTAVSAQTTVREIRQRAQFQANARIRQMARRVYRDSGLPFRCCVCGYSTHVEICHKRSISEFPDDTLVSEVNANSNLVCLCPNHHWEFDHGLLSL